MPHVYLSFIPKDQNNLFKKGKRSKQHLTAINCQKNYLKKCFRKLTFK